MSHLSLGAEVVPFDEADKVLDPHKIRCLDCGGWPIPGGAIFIPVAHCKSGTPVEFLTPGERTQFTPMPTVGFICELCFVERLQRRAHIVSATSTPKEYYSYRRAKSLLREKAAEQRQTNKRVGRERD